MATATAPKTCALLLVIDGQMYRVLPLERGAAYRLFKMGSEDLAYDVAREHGLVTCTCGNYEFRRRGVTAEPCKHGVALVEVGLLADAPEPEPVALHPVRHRGANGRWYDDEREARSAYSWQQDDGRERP